VIRFAPTVLLCLAAAVAFADEATPPGEAGSIEAWSYRYGFDFTNEKEHNQFVVEEQGLLLCHSLGNLEGAQQWLDERQAKSRELTKVVLRGQEIPAEIIKAQAGALFTAESRFEVEAFGVADVSALRLAQLALESQFADDWVIKALGSLCMRDWERLRREARGAGEIVWELPALYRAFHVQEEPGVQADLRTVTATLSGEFSGRMGRRTLKSFRFEGLYDLVAQTFVRVEVHGVIRNDERGLEQSVSLSRERLDNRRVPAQELRTYRQGARQLAAAVTLAHAGRHTEAWDLFQAVRVPDRLAGTAKQHFARVERFAGGVPWGEGREALAAAQVRARREGKPILVLFDQLNCPPCQILHRTVLTAAEFVAAVDGRLIPVHLDLCREPEAALTYEIRGTPTLLVLDADLEVLSRQEGVAPLAQALGLLDEGVAAFPR